VSDKRESVRPTIAELEAILNDPHSPPVEITPAGEVVAAGLNERIRHAINSVCAENGSNTHDFILADYLVSCLAAFDRATNERERMYGRNPRLLGPDPRTPSTGTADPPQQSGSDQPGS
jgi:hypothetical protein